VFLSSSGFWLGLVNLSHLLLRHLPELDYTLQMDLLQPWSDLGPYHLIQTSISYTCTVVNQKIWSEMLVKGPHQENPAPSIGSQLEGIEF